MAKQKETTFKDSVLKELRAEWGSDIWIEKIQQRSTVGTPDTLACIRGLFVAIEFKTDIGRPEPKQKRKLALIDHARGFTSVMRPWNREAELERLRRHVRARGS